MTGTPECGDRFVPLYKELFRNRMNRNVVLLGSVPDSDRMLIAAAAEAEGCGLCDISGAGPAGAPHEVIGYISYQACDRWQILDFFSSIPLGLAQDFPFYQLCLTDREFESIAGLPVFGVFRTPLSLYDARNMIRAMTRMEAALGVGRELVGEVARYRREKNNLMRVGVALSTENDLQGMLSLILSEARAAVAADAGSIYVRELSIRDGKPANRLLFKVAQNDSVAWEKVREVPVPIGAGTIAGHVALTGETLDIEDVYAIDAQAPYAWGRDFDARFGYRTRSMLTVPLKNLDGEVVGVLQLMNKKIDPAAQLTSAEMVALHVAPFACSDRDYVLSIAPLAAVSIERAQLYKSIQDIFEGYLSSSAAAIDERDRVTSGHSKRVMGYAMAFAEAINAQARGPLSVHRFSPERVRQFKFAALLHDIGKIGVPEALLTRERRISGGRLDTVRMRGEYLKLMLNRGVAEHCDWTSAPEVDADIAFIEEVNAAGFLSDEMYARLAAIRAKSYSDTQGRRHPFLTDDEWERLSIRSGNLTAAERTIINSHAQATRRILSKIPWTRGLREIPDIACHHHERIDGSGYPDHLQGDQIPLESRILAIVDIYESLVAQDRPYKRSMTPEMALTVLREEADLDHLDADLVKFFIKKGIYRLFTEGNEGAPPSES